MDANRNTDGPQRNSYVFPPNAHFDLGTKVTLGGKIGYRMSETAARGSDNISANTTA